MTKVLITTPSDVYNPASGVEATIRELAETLLALADSDSEPEVAPRRSWDHVGRCFGSTAKSRQELGFEAAVGLQDSLRRTVEWTGANIDRMDASVDRHADRLATA